jgi:lipopolysaccharide transport system permease protein
VELWQYRELLFFFAWRDVKVRYKQTALGAAWAVIQPLATTFLFSLVFGRLAGLAGHVEGSYALHVFAGLIPWTFFANAVTQSANSLVGSSHLISKVYFPRLLIPMSPVLVGLLDFAIAFVALLVMMPFFGVVLDWRIVTAPLFVIGTIAAAAGAGAFFSAVVVTYRDFRFVMTFLIQLWLFATPVFYALDIIPRQWHPFYALNPLVGMIAGFRASVLGQPFPGGVILVSTISAFVMFSAGVQYFGRVERRFADVI